MHKFCYGCIYSLNLTNACWLVAIECKRFCYTTLKLDKFEHEIIVEISNIFKDHYCACSNCILRPICEDRLDKTRVCQILDEGFEEFKPILQDNLIKRITR
jgi:hypothetical protein